MNDKAFQAMKTVQGMTDFLAHPEFTMDMLEMREREDEEMSRIPRQPAQIFDQIKSGVGQKMRSASKLFGFGGGEQSSDEDEPGQSFVSDRDSAYQRFQEENE